MIKNVDIGTLDKIVKKTISSIRDSRGQIYDVYEMARDELETVKKIVKEEMEAAFPLNVPLVADMGVGNNWLEAH